MKKILSILTLALGLTLATSPAAHAGAGRWGKDLTFVAETQIPAAGGQSYALCHLVDFMEVLFVPVYTSIEGYALSADRCDGTSYRLLTPEQFAELQQFGMVDTSLPVEPSLSPKDFVVGHAGLFLAALAGLFKALAWFIHDRKPRRRAKGSDALAVNALAAMAHVAVCDGNIDNNEVSQIAGILTRLTGRGYDRDRVMQLLQQIQMQGNDINHLGEGLSEAECKIVMEAALNVAVADGQIHPNEYNVVSQIANRLRIDGGEFRTALTRISARMHGGEPVV